MMGNKKHVLTQILGSPEGDKKEVAGESPLHSCVEELIHAVHAKDIEGAVQALKACFAELEAEPHSEGPHTEEY